MYSWSLVPRKNKDARDSVYMYSVYVYMMLPEDTKNHLGGWKRDVDRWIHHWFQASYYYYYYTGECVCVCVLECESASQDIKVHIWCVI